MDKILVLSRKEAIAIWHSKTMQVGRLYLTIYDFVELCLTCCSSFFVRQLSPAAHPTLSLCQVLYHGRNRSKCACI